MQDEHMIEALTPHTAKETLTDRIGSRGAIRGFEYLDATCLRNPREAHPKLAIVIPDEVRADLRHRWWRTSAVVPGPASVGERGDVWTPTWMTLRECSSMMKKARQRSEEEIRNRQARVRTCPTSALVAL